MMVGKRVKPGRDMVGIWDSGKRCRLRRGAGLLAASPVLTIATILAVVLALGASRAWAATGIGVSPGRFEVEVPAGQAAQNVLKVTNEGDKPLEIRAYSMDRRVQSGGQIEFLPAGNPADSPAAWLSVEPDRFSLAPGQEQEVRWKLAVPPEAIPGDHVAVLFFQTAPEARPGTVSIGSRVGALVSVRVAGEAVVSGRLVSFQIPSPRLALRLAPFGRPLLAFSWNLPFPLFEYGPVPVVATFENTGNARLPVTGNVEIKDLLGRVVGMLTMAEPAHIYPRDTDSVTLTWEGVPLLGRFAVAGRFMAGNQEATAHTVFYVFPVKRALSVLLLAVGALLLLHSGRRRMKAKTTFPGASGPPPGGVSVPPSGWSQTGLPSRRDRKRQR